MPTAFAPPPVTYRSALRILGAAGMFCAPALLVDVVARARFGEGNPKVLTAGTWLGLAYLGGWVCSLAGLRRLRAWGTGTVAGALFWIQLGGLALAACQNCMELSAHGWVRMTLLFTVCDAAWPLSHLCMMATGIMVLKEQCFRGPMRFATLCCGLTLPFSFAVRFFGRSVMDISFGIVTCGAFMTLGYSVYKSGRALE